MKACLYSDFLGIIKNSTHSLPREFIILATKNIECRIAFFVYLLLLDLAFQPNVERHTVSVAQREVADFLNVSLRTIKRAIAFLKQKGYLHINREQPKKGGYQLNQIQVLFPDELVKPLLNLNSQPLNISNVNHAIHLTPSFSLAEDNFHEKMV